MHPANASAPAPGEAAAMRAKLSSLRVEFVDLAFTLERRGRIEAADVALAASARIGEICDERPPARAAQAGGGGATEAPTLLSR